MTEDEMKKKQCPHLSLGAMMLVIEMGKNGSPLKEITTALDDAALCSGSECAMWEPEYDEEIKQIPTADDIPEGWHSKPYSISVQSGNQTIIRYVKAKRGDCGLKTKENGCFYPGQVSM